MRSSLPRQCLLPLLLLVLLDGRPAFAAACTYVLSPTSQSFGPMSGMGNFHVQTEDGCSWSPSRSADWFALAGITGPFTGSGSVTFFVSENGWSSISRSGTITVGDQAFTVSQSGVPCSYSLSHQFVDYSPEGAPHSFSVQAPSGCTWSASTSSSWISITSGSGSGDGTVSFSVPTNSDASRSGMITVADQTFIVVQRGAYCFYNTPTYYDPVFNAQGGVGSFSVSVESGCPWSASTPASWISFTSGTGTGNGTVSYAVSANPGTSLRSTFILVGNLIVQVRQERAPCTYRVSPASQSVGPGGFDSYWGIFSVQTQSYCSWFAQATKLWIHIDRYSARSTGNDDILYSVGTNPSTGSRTGAIVVRGIADGGATFTVHQEGTGVPVRPPAADFDGDGTADWVLYRHGAWLYFGPCGHPLNERGPALDPACSSCVARICTSFTPYCCDHFWDSFCVDAVKFMCQ